MVYTKKQIYSDIKTNFQSGKELYISIGAGIWNIDLMDDGKTLISYRLFIDPLPDFAVDHVNKVNIVNLFFAMLLMKLGAELKLIQIYLISYLKTVRFL